jgi:transposase
MLWEHVTFPRFTEYRVKCPTCGLKVESLPWVARYARVTVPLASLVAELCKAMTNKAVAALQALNRKTVKAIDKAAMLAAQAARSLEGITVLGFDEIAVGKGHNYWHMVSALEGPYGSELLYIGEGRKEKDLKKFWKWFGQERAGRVTHAVMDMWKGFINSVRDHCRRKVGDAVVTAQIIYDKFHVIRHLLNALNRVRQQELSRAKGRFKGLLTGKKFILLSRQAHVRGKAREALNDLLVFSKKLMKAHLLKESFGHLWSFKSKTWARKFFEGWVKDLRWSRLKPYHKFVKMVDRHLDGILAFCDKKVPLGYIEATNLKAKNIIRRAYGYRDKEYMKLKIIQACSHLGAFHPWKSSFNFGP